MDADRAAISEADQEMLCNEAEGLDKYSLRELLSQCDANAAISEDERAWTTGEAVGREEI